MKKNDLEMVKQMSDFARACMIDLLSESGEIDLSDENVDKIEQIINKHLPTEYHVALMREKMRLDILKERVELAQALIKENSNSISVDWIVKNILNIKNEE
jgi:hypothetical protein